MASFSLEFKPSVEKDFRSIPKEAASRVWVKIEALASNPLPPGSVKLSGSDALHRIRIGDYRVVYAVDNGARQVLIHYVRHRREAYR
jgi:mRNA interferase RelE/StbE